MNNTIYMDHNATTSVRPAVVDAVVDAMVVIGNASSVHGSGRQCKRILENARDQVAGVINCQSENVIFTGSGTEANNLALRGLSDIPVLASTIEHASVRSVVDHEKIAVDAQGVVNLDQLLELLKKQTGRVLVSVMLANNETGAIQPVKDIVRIAKSFDAVVHCDAVQALGKIDVDMIDLGVDMMTLSAHKIGGPQGVGALILSPAVEIEALIKGGGQEHRHRAGTENLPGIAGFGEAAKQAKSERGNFSKLTVLRDQIDTAIQSMTGRAAYSSSVARLANTSYLSMPGVKAETQVMAFDLEGIAISAGSACSSGKVEASHVLSAMGLGEDDASSAIRVSLGWNSTQDDVDHFIDVWKMLYNRLSDDRVLAKAV